MDALKYHFKRVLKEVIGVLLISTLPVWLGSLLLPVIDQSAPLYRDIPSYLGKIYAVYYNIAGAGDLALYSCSFMAAIAYLVGENYEDNFPWKMTYISVIAVITFVSATIYVSNVTALKGDPNLTAYSSLAVFGVSLVVWIAAVVNKNTIVDPAGAMRESERDFMSGYKSHKEGSR